MSNQSRVVDPVETTGSDLDQFEAGIVENKPDFEMPEKFQGKSVEEVVQSHVNLEKKFGQQGQEVGQLRSEVNQLRQQLNQPVEQKPRKPVEVDELLENPDGAINQAIESNERLQTIERKLAEDDLRRNKSVFESRHPDWQEVVASDGFQQWLNSNAERKRRWDDADRNYNYESGDEIMQTYKDIHAARSEQAAQQKQQELDQGLRDAGTVRRGSGGTGKKRQYQRSWLINLQVNEPEKYEANRKEIEAAYREGRVYE